LSNNLVRAYNRDCTFTEPSRYVMEIKKILFNTLRYLTKLSLPLVKGEGKKAATFAKGDITIQKGDIRIVENQSVPF
jgi:hypothetical protein